MLHKYSKLLILYFQIYDSFSKEIKTVKCESYFSRNLSTFEINVKFCRLRRTAIGSDNVEIIPKASENATELFFDSNQDIEYLPVKVRENFPNLLSISAYYCKVKSISPENFKNLSKLLVLSLKKNELVTIESNTFDDLINLKVLLLSDNLIIYIDSKAFESLIYLTRLDLIDNKCIQMNFTSSKEASKFVGSQCSIKTTTTARNKQNWMEYFLQTTLPD